MTNAINYAVKLSYDRLILLQNLPQCKKRRREVQDSSILETVSTNKKQKPRPHSSKLVRVTPPVLTIKLKQNPKSQQI